MRISGPVCFGEIWVRQMSTGGRISVDIMMMIDDGDDVDGLHLQSKGVIQLASWEPKQSS